MKKYFILLLIFSCFSIKLISAQETPLRIDYAPKSPESSSLFNFEDIIVGNYTGAMNLNIPITSLTSGPLSTSVSLSYDSSGNKVSQRATWVGLGWNLNAGGAVVREVRGFADDSDSGVGFLNFSQNYNSVLDIVTLDDLAKFALYDDLSAFRCKDAEPDIFSFNVGGLTGKFMFDWDGSLKVSCNRNIVVSYIQAQGSFNIEQWQIIDDQGSVYVFSKKEANDITNILGMGAGACPNQPYTASWKLTSMEDYSGQHRIDFSYEDYSMNYPVVYSKQHTLSKYGAHESYYYGQSGFEIDGSYISNITVANTQRAIEFNKDISNIRTDVTGTNLYPLGSVTLKDENNNIVNEYQFEYTLNNRLKLDEINHISSNSSLLYYAFEYNSTPLPDYDSYATDHWGYYNGVNNFEPYPAFVFKNINQTITNLPGADKRANLANSEAGILKKIIYPTKGYTEIMYENHDYSFIQSQAIPIKYEQLSETVSSFVQGLSSPNTNTWVTENIPFTVDINNNTSDENTVCFGTTCLRKISIDVTAINLFPFASGVNGPKYYIYDSNDNIVKTLTAHVPYNQNEYCNGGNHQELDEVWLEAGNYRLVTETKNIINSSCPQVKNYINVILSYQNDSGAEVYKETAGGLRVKEVSNYDHTDGLITKRVFEYTLNDNSNISSGSIPILPVYEDIHQFWDSNENADWEHVRYSGSLFQLGSSIGHVKYNEVNIKQVNGSETLKTKYKYSMGDDDVISLAQPYSPPISSKPYKKGLLTNEIVYRSSGNTFTPVFETIYEYGFYQHQIEALKVSREITGICSCSDPGLFAEGRYDNYLGYSQMLNKKTKTIIDQSILEQESIFNYDLNLTRMINSSVETSEGENLLKTYIYPDTDSPSSINTEMINKNMIATPIKVKAFKDGVLLSTQYTQYKNWGLGIIAPEFIQISKGQLGTGGLLENHLIYHDYDGLGNLTEVSKADGTKIVYIMGYDYTLPVAKIENASLSDISASLLSSIYTASDSGTESQLIIALTNLRSDLSNAFVTTYTHKPLIGVSTVTDPKGYTMYYEYDEFNRLKHVKDKNGHILGKNEYNYKNQY